MLRDGNGLFNYFEVVVRYACLTDNCIITLNA